MTTLPSTNLDPLFKAALQRSPSLFIPWFLCTSFLYYKLDEGVISDTLFDTACKDALRDWRKLAHEHKPFVKPSMLSAGTGFDLPWRRLPSRVIGGAYSMLAEFKALRGSP